LHVPDDDRTVVILPVDNPILKDFHRSGERKLRKISSGKTVNSYEAPPIRLGNFCSGKASALTEARVQRTSAEALYSQKVDQNTGIE